MTLTVGGLAALDWRLALAALAAAPIQALGLRAYLRKVVPIYRLERAAEGERTQQLVGAISGASTARALGLGGQRREHVRASSQAAARAVAHRLTQAARADRVIVLEAGQVVEEGTRAVLLRAAGRYAELWRAWEQPR